MPQLTAKRGIRWYAIKALSAAAAELSIHGEIGEDGITAKDFIADLRGIKASAITLSINSPGGSVFDGIAIYNALKQHPAKITVRVMGVAASAASLIAMSGDTIIMPKNSFMMIHNPIGTAYGNAEDMRELAAALDKISAALVATYVARTGQSEAKIKAMLAAETWLSAADAVRLHFADSIEDEARISASFNTARFPERVKAVFSKSAKQSAQISTAKIWAARNSRPCNPVQRI